MTVLAGWVDATLASPRNLRRLPLLDGMRGIAALAVVYYHAHHFGLVGPLVVRGYLFVDFFFLLSGFVLGLSIDPKLRSGLSPQNFMIKRIRRLWPIMAVGTIIGVLPFALVGELQAALVLLPLSLAMLPALGSRVGLFPLNGPVWSLTMELIANAIHAVLLCRCGRAALASFVAINAALLVGAIRYYGYLDTLGTTAERWLPGVARVCFSYGFGLLLAREWLTDGRLASVRWPWWAAVGVPLLAVVGLPYVPLTGWVGDALVTLAILPVGFALSVGAHLPERLVPLFRGLGLLSYPLYAVHVPILILSSIWFVPLAGRLIGPTATLLAAAGLAYVLEIPQTAGAAERRSGPEAARDIVEA